jgi:acetyl-CoA synthetase
MTRERDIISAMDAQRIFPPSAELSKRARIKSMEEYRSLYQESLADPEAFWGRLAQELVWFRKWERVLMDDFAHARHAWFTGGTLNAAYNCLDSHLQASRKDKAALVWEGEPEGETKIFTYQQLYEEVCRFANVLKKHRVKQGDRVTIYLPMIPELPIAMLACARIGAIHSVILSAFSAESVRERIEDAKASIVICCDAYYQEGRIVESKAVTNAALAQLSGVRKVFVVRRSGMPVDMQEGRDAWWHEEMAVQDITAACKPAELDAEAPLFILYTSGSTGKPKGVLHTIAGYLLSVKKTFELIFDYHEGDVIWCTADFGWITGHSYGLYGPLCAGATTVIVEGSLSYPQPDRLWEIVERHRVSIFYTTPTTVQARMREGDEWVNRHDLGSLRVLGSVGDPINPEAWMWYYTVVGKERCPIIDTWWQTETGGAMITPLPGAIPLKPGSATLPFFGVEPAILREDGTECEVDEGGYLVIKRPWPGMMRSSYGEPEQFKETYFVQFPGMYFTGDWAKKDADGYYWLMGRVDDVIKVRGYRVGAVEIEHALASHEAVAEAAVVGFPHETKGQGIYAFIVVKPGVEESEELKAALAAHCRAKISPLAIPDRIQFVPVISKTIQGKTMRRILRKIAEGDIRDLGDTSTLADRSVVDSLFEGRR